MTKSNSEVARWFDAIDQLGGANFGEEVFPGYPGAVAAKGALVSMTWGFPLSRKGAKGQPLKPKPVNNTRADKLAGFFWRYSFAERRCLIPLTAWAEAEGPKGGKTRSWLSDPDGGLLAAAGVWRDSDEWGRCYSMVMTEAAGPAADCHDRMPVILAPGGSAVLGPGRWRLTGRSSRGRAARRRLRSCRTLDRAPPSHYVRPHPVQEPPRVIPSQGR
mgnify:CR=1 FL=1